MWLFLRKIIFVKKILYQLKLLKKQNNKAIYKVISGSYLYVNNIKDNNLFSNKKNMRFYGYDYKDEKELLIFYNIKTKKRIEKIYNDFNKNK